MPIPAAADGVSLTSGESTEVDRSAKSLEEGQAVLKAAAQCLSQVARQLDQRFVKAVELIFALGQSRGQLILSGVGKAGHIASKVSATFASTGTPSIYVHPTDALHGDLGRIGASDVLLALSNSGASAEVVRLITPVRSIGAKLIAVTSDANSALAKEADVALTYGPVAEAGHLGLAPTTSTTALLAIGDALAMAVLARKNLTPAEFARFHPGGSLGRSLMRVHEAMRKDDANPVIAETATVLEAIHVMGTTRGRPGAVSVVGASGELVGFYTDGDERRQLEANAANAERFLKSPIREFMTRSPRTIGPDQLLSEAVRLLREMKIDQLPVIDADRRPIGLIDVQDLLDVRVLS